MSSFDDIFGSFSRRLRLIVALLLEGANNRENDQKDGKGTVAYFATGLMFAITFFVEINHR